MVVYRATVTFETDEEDTEELAMTIEDALGTWTPLMMTMVWVEEVD